MKLLDPLQENKQLKLFKEYEQGKSQAIREKLILHNLKLVAWTIKRYYDTNILEYDDYFQIGAIGLMKAIEGYDYTKGAFSTYSIYWIRQTIERDIENYGRTIRIPSHMMEKINKIKSIRESLTNILGRSPTVKEISIKAGLKIKEVNEILKEIDEPISLSTPTGVNDSSMTLEDTIQDDSLTLDLSVENKIIMKEFKEESKRILTDIEYKIITKHLGIDTRVHTLKELSIRFNYSNKDKVRTIRDRALRKIKRNMYIKNLWEEVEEKTLYYRSIDYSQTMVSGGTVSSSVENIALSREKQFNQLDKGDFKG